MTITAASTSIFLLVFLGIHGQVTASLGGSNNEDFADCGGCYCIPDNGDPCPDNTLKPETDFSDIIPNLRALSLTNSQSLSCDPYNDASSCPRFSTETSGVCVVEINVPATGETCPDAHTYSLVTYSESLEDALANHRYVTHDTPCGYCSSLQDLSVYMEQGPNLLNAATRCGFKGLVSRKLAVKCFEHLGFTESCATVWSYNTQNTRENCFGTCLLYTLFGNGNPNTEAPTCDLVDCVDCDETNSGPVFAEYAGRTRRNSGLLSNIARPCSETIQLDQTTDPCSFLK